MKVRSVFNPDEHETAPKDYPVNFSLLLEKVNQIRLALGIGEGVLEALPPGEREHSSQCVLARALSNGWKASVKASVSDTIDLTPPKEIKDTFDFNKAVSILTSLGFHEVNVLNSNDLTEEEFTSYQNNRQRTEHKPFNPSYISFLPSKTMGNFIERFDEGQFPDLILND